jgi:hypothetical protein
MEKQARLNYARRRDGRTVYAENPECPEDEFTDRWPCDLAEQRVFMNELRGFAFQLRRAQGVPLPEMQHILQDLFGERAAGDEVRAYYGQHIEDGLAGTTVHVPSRGSMTALGSAVLGSPAVRPTPKHNFYGDPGK